MENTPTPINLDDLQQRIHHWITTTGVTYFSELTNLGVLMEEVGELSRIMTRTYGDQSFKPTETPSDLSDELADILWVLCAIANQTGVNLTEAIQKNIEKKNNRDATRHLSNDKLKRPE